VGTVYWITRVMVLYGGLNWFVAVLINAALIAYLALFPAVFAVVFRRLTMAYGGRAMMAAPFVWVATELGRTHVFGGFPWVLLGYSQVSVTGIAQFASIAGVYGLSALTAASASVVAILTFEKSDRRARWPYVWSVGVLGVLVLITVWGQARVARGELTSSGSVVKVGLIQGNVDQAEKWNEARASAIFSEYLRMTRQAIAGGAEVVLWPESSTPFFFEENRAGAEQIRALARQAHVPILVGSDQIERGAPTKYYNSAFLVRADGSTAGVYRKMHLVPFGEYVPMKQVLFFAAPLVEAVSDFSPGETAVLLPVAGHQMSTAICYEIVYPDLVRRFVAGGSELLTTITNDAWFGRTSAPYQHFAQAAMRAIENGRYLVRAANTGISGIVDPYGRVVARSDLFQPAVMVGDARFLSASTFYTRHGDVFAYAAAVLTLVMLLQSRVWPQSTT
jgi:apolipoprotein N-acyltransferase